MTDLFRIWEKAALAPLFFVMATISCASAQAGTLSPPDIVQLQFAAKVQRLEADRVWLSLLHMERGKRHITDRAFFISENKFSPDEEMRATIAALWGGQGRDVLCKFPARALWLQAKLGAPLLPVEQCPDVVEFLQNSSDDHLDLVFAADSLSSPSSFLGHSFFKFSGQSSKGNEVSHAVSFYTDTKTNNYPKLILESFVTGRKGYFALTTYASSLDLYLRGEQRKVWEYRLNLNAFQRRLIMLHALELKRIEQKYLYIGYNCATVIRFLLQLSGAQWRNPALWTTPKDVIRSADQAGLIDHVQVYYPNRALIRALFEGTSRRDQASVFRAIKTGAVEALGGNPRLLHLALAENSFAQEEKLISPLQAERNVEQLSKELDVGGAKAFLSLDPQTDPRNSSGERQISLQAGLDAGLPTVRLTWLPASHFISDDNHDSSHETELKLMSGTLEKRGSGGPALQQLTLFGMTTLLPRHAVIGGLSGRFSFGMETQLDNAMNRRHPFVVDGGLGLTKRITPDIDVYALAGGGFGLLNVKPLAYAKVQVGAVIREVWKMKTIASWTYNASSMASGVKNNSIGITQVKNITKYLAIAVDWSVFYNKNLKNESAMISIKHRF